MCFSSQKKSKQILAYEIEKNDVRKELYLLKNKAYNLRNFSTFAAILKILNPQCIAMVVRTPRSALVNVRRKALLSSVGLSKRMTSRSPRGIYWPVTHVCFCFDRPLWCVWWSDGLFRGLVVLFRSSLDWFNQEDATASVWKWCFNVWPPSSLFANWEGPFSGCYWVTSLGASGKAGNRNLG